MGRWSGPAPGAGRLSASAPSRRLALTPSRTRSARDFQRLLRAQGQVEVGRIDVAQFAPAAVAMARRLWEERTVVEHRSATVFSDLLPQLRDVGVPLDLEAVVLQCALDEIRHAELCGRLAQALGGDGAQPCELRARRLPRHGDVSPRTRLLRNVVYACAMSETLATAMLTMSRDEAREPNVRRVLQALLADEVRHSRFGWDVLEHLAPLGDQDRRDLERYLRFAFAHWEGAVPRRPGGSKRLPADAAALGVPSPAASYALFENVVAEAILPGLERHGVDARRAWRKRDPASP